MNVDEIQAEAGIASALLQIGEKDAAISLNAAVGELAGSLTFTPPPAAVCEQMNFNSNWQFIRQDVLAGEQTGFYDVALRQWLF